MTMLTVDSSWKTRVESLIALAMARAVAAASSAVHWANDLKTSTDFHQWVSGISGTNGTGATCTQRSGLTLTLTQGGPLGAPINEFPIDWQPRNPAKSPFGFTLQTFFFNGVDDNVVGYGYNLRQDPAQPVCQFTIESDFSPVPGARQLECYLASNTAGGGPNAVRPFGYVLNILTGVLSLGLQWSGTGGFVLQKSAVGGPGVTSVAFNDQIMQLEPGYFINGLGSATYGVVGTHTIYAQSAVSGSELSALFFGIGNQFRSLVAFIDNQNIPGECAFYPFGANKGALGFGSNTWGQVNTNALSTAQVTKSAAYTIDSAGAHDCIVWVDTSATPAFPLTLPDPATNKGRRLLVQDVGGNLAAANVTLTRHGDEKINGAAANLALVTNRATWEITSDGTDWVTGKSVTGG